MHCVMCQACCYRPCLSKCLSALIAFSCPCGAAFVNNSLAFEYDCSTPSPIAYLRYIRPKLYCAGACPCSTANVEYSRALVVDCVKPRLPSW